MIGKGFFAPEVDLPEWNGETGGIACWFQLVDFDTDKAKNTLIIAGAGDESGGSFLLYTPQFTTDLLLWSKVTHPVSGQRIEKRILRSRNFKDWKSGEWHHVALTWKKGEFAKLFIDGQETDSQGENFSFPWPGPFSKIRIAQGMRRNQGFGLDGTAMIRELNVFTTVLTEPLIKTMAERRPVIDRAAPDDASAKVPTNTMIPVTSPAQQPQCDGVVGKREYPTTIDGLIKDLDHNLYMPGGAIHLAMDQNALYLAGRVRLADGHALRSVAQENQDNRLIDQGDLFTIMLRADQQIDSRRFSGLYLSVAPNGSSYIARETVSWDGMSCKRETVDGSNVRSASQINDGWWTVELQIPHSISGLNPSQEAQLSAHFHLANSRLSLVDCPVWLDHWQAFAMLKPGALGLKVTNGWLAAGQVAPGYQLELRDPAAGPIACSIRGSILTAEIREAFDTIRYDELVGQKLAISNTKVVEQWQRGATVSADQPASVQVRHDIAKVGTYMLNEELHAGDQPAYRRRMAFSVQAPVQLTLRPLPPADRLKAYVSLYGFADVVDNKSLQLTFRRNGQVDLVHQLPIHSQQFVFDFSMAKLQPGDYDVEVALLDGKEVRFSTHQSFTKWQTPQWLRDRAGIEALEPQWCPAPWTPLQVQDNAVQCWGRTHQFGVNSLLTGITSQDEQLLASPITINYRIGKETLTVPLSMPQVQAKAAGRVTAQQAGQTPHLAVTANHRFEFDGFHRIALTLSPDKPINVDEVWIEMTFRNITVMGSGRGSLPMGPVESRQIFSNACPWVGNERVGCGVTFETWKGCQIDSRKPRITLDVAGTDATMKLFLVNDPTSLQQPVFLEMALQASPYKPYFPGWRAIRPEGWSPRRNSPSNVLMLDPRTWTASYARPTPRNWETLQYYVDFCSDTGQRLYPYTQPWGISPYDSVNSEYGADRKYTTQQKFWEELERYRLYQKTGKVDQIPGLQRYKTKQDAPKLPEFQYFYEDWNLSPAFILPDTHLETNEQVYVSPGSTWADYWVYHLSQVLQRSKVGGFYLDLASPRLKGRINFDESQGMAYYTKDGIREGTAEIFAARDLYKRLYCEFDKLRGPEQKPYLLGHGSSAFIGIAPFWDVAFSGEGLRLVDWPWGLSQFMTTGSTKKGDKTKPEYSGLRYRAQYGNQYGLPAMFLPQYVAHRATQTQEMTREILSWTLPHNTIIWPYHAPADIMYKVWRDVEEPFDIGAAQFHGYWDNEARSDPHIKLSYWVHPDNGKTLVVIANWSDKAVEAAIVPPVQLKGWTTATDPLDGSTWKLEETWHMTLARNDFRLLMLEGKK
jgi:hypothetical protein